MLSHEESRTRDDAAERFVPELMSGELIDAEHQARYRLALPHVRGRRVLDAGCGTGWGCSLLLTAGAHSVVGVDLSNEAVTNCRKTVPDAEFRIGNLQNLPADDGDFDVVVCFEALEHTTDTDATLDELVRVLTADGLLFVSSPNPKVYKPGNPFHLHEMPPEELYTAVSARLSNVAMYRQHLHLSSLVAPEALFGVSDISPFTHLVVPLAEGHDAYSVAVGSNGILPKIGSVECLCPSDQLDNLDALVSALMEERTSIHADHDRIVVERKVLLDRLEIGAREREQVVTAAAEAETRLRDADRQLRSLIEERDAAQAQLRDADRQLRFLMNERDSVAIALQETASERDRLNSLAIRIGNERDYFAQKLVDVEQELALHGECGDEAVFLDLRR